MGIATPAPALPARLGRFWWLPVAAGAITLIVGVAALAYPGPTLVAVGFLFGAYLVVWGFLTLLDSTAAEALPVIVRVFAGILALISVLAGLVLMVRPGESVTTAALVLGLWWVLSGMLQVARGLVLAEGRVPNVLWGLLGIVAGAVILAQPQIGLGALVLVVAIGLMVQGIFEIAAGFQLRALHERAAT